MLLAHVSSAAVALPPRSAPRSTPSPLYPRAVGHGIPQQWGQAWEDALREDARAAGQVDAHALGRACQAARAFAEDCLPGTVEHDVYDLIATPLALLFLFGDLPAPQTREVRAHLDDILGDSPCELHGWAAKTLRRWWSDLAAERDVSPLLRRLLRDDLRGVLASPVTGRRWDLDSWERHRVPAVGLRAFTELARILLQIPLPAGLTPEALERSLYLAALAARMLNDAGSLPRDLAGMRTGADVADPNWILIRARMDRPGDDPRGWTPTELAWELDACRRIHNVALDQLERRLSDFAASPFYALVYQIQNGHDRATRRVATRYDRASERLRGFSRLTPFAQAA